MNRPPLILPALAAVLAAAGCATPLASPTIPPGQYPFAPAALRVHPLTHVDPAADQPGQAGKCLVVLHLELRDAFGDAVKGAGTLGVELYRPGGGTSPGMETQALVWDVPDFADPARNSARFDPATRTYRLPLLADGWVARWLTRDGEAARQGAPAWLKVRVTLRPPGATQLSDEFILQR